MLDKCSVFKNTFFCAGVAELVDAPDLGSGAERRGGSSPFTRTTIYIIKTMTYKEKCLPFLSDYDRLGQIRTSRLILKNSFLGFLKI